jgi:hypothetical protein
MSIVYYMMQGRRRVFRELQKQQPTVKLLYTTPEQLKSSEGLLEVLGSLHSRWAAIQLIRFIQAQLAGYLIVRIVSERDYS